jgi:putative ABC transport system permease protein
MFNWIKLIERNMRRNLRRTILTTLTIALAAFIYTVLVSVPASMDRVVKDASGTLRLFVVNKTAPWEDLPARYCDQIDKMPGVAACVGITGWFATWRDISNTILGFGAGPEIGDVFPDYQLSRENQLRTARERRAATVGTVLMHKMGWKLGDHITLRGTDTGHMQMDFIITNTIDNERYPNTFLFRRDYLMEARKAAGEPDEDIAWNIIVRVNSVSDLHPVAKNIDEHFANSDYETRTLTESDAIAAGLSAVGNIRGIVLALCAVVVLTVLLIAANSTAMMVRERISEVAVMRSLGFSRSSISILLFGEVGFIGAVGGLIGAGIALWKFHSGITLGAALGGNGALWVTPEQALNAVLVAVAVSLVSGLVPILEALRISPAMAFRKVI